MVQLKKIHLLIIILFCRSIITFGQVSTEIENNAPQKLPFQSGEWFEYRIHYGIFNASYASLELVNDTIKGLPVLHATVLFGRNVLRLGRVPRCRARAGRDRRARARPPSAGDERRGGSRRWRHRDVCECGSVPRGGTAAARADCCGGRAAARTDRCLTTLRFAVSPDPVIAG